MFFQFLCTISVFAQQERPRDVYADMEAGWKNMDQILERIKGPVFPEQQFVITDYGAEEHGKMCTEAFRNAILACHEAGGGRVVVPEGSFLTGAIHLLSNVELHVSEGATILFSTDPKDYLPVLSDTRPIEIFLWRI